ncbi:hypothetical protein GCM10010172_65880 [Paractinoplanes ferrugineus]|uniref:Acyl-CoA dehydrogenase n=1 Tax=Paractinoplanes ferrugineus TaxID=113564 RepID=A0A919J9U9_9ACTN|nr:acyl-CoA dehydrogenase [Actinoplanes ferrugineus]GIE13251.1 hypothetical protein Afe05nite_50910 [Actinoplanes ferrugineus]
MSNSAWQRLAPPTADRRPSADSGLTEILEALDGYLAEPGTTASLAAAETAGEYPREVLTGMRRHGLAELFVPDRATSPHLGLLNVLTARRSGSLAITVGVNALALLPVYLGGSPEQCEQVTRRLRAGRSAAMLLTELAHGSNLLRNEASAAVTDDGYRLIGEKHLINGGTEHEMLVTFMRTRRSPADRPMEVLRDFSVFLVDRDATTPALPRWRTVPARSADISGVRFENTAVPRTALVGREGDGFSVIQKSLRMSHAGIAALASGAVSGALELAVSHARTRDVYGQPIAGLGAIADHCARMAALDVVVAALAIKASLLAGAMGPAAAYFSAAAKYACCRFAEEAVSEGRQVLGARALLDDSGYSRFVRDILLYGVFDGTSHVMLEDLSWYPPRFAAAGEARPGTFEQLRSSYTAEPQPIRSQAARPWRPYAPALSARCGDLVRLTADPMAARVADLVASFDTVVRAARSSGAWTAGQAMRFEVTGVLAELEALLATAELTLAGARREFGLGPVAEPDEDAARYAISWLGDRLADRLSRLAIEATDTVDPATACRDRVRARVSA